MPHVLVAPSTWDTGGEPWTSSIALPTYAVLSDPSTLRSWARVGASPSTPPSWAWAPRCGQRGFSAFLLVGAASRDAISSQRGRRLTGDGDDCRFAVAAQPGKRRSSLDRAARGRRRARVGSRGERRAHHRILARRMAERQRPHLQADHQGTLSSHQTGPTPLRKQKRRYEGSRVPIRTLQPFTDQIYCTDVNWVRDDGDTVADDRGLDLAVIHRWLGEESYWAEGRTIGVVAKSIARSVSLGCFSPSGDTQGR